MTSRCFDRGSAADQYTVYAVQYGLRAGTRGEHFLGWDERSAERHDTAYYAWLVLSNSWTVLVDCGIGSMASGPLSGWVFCEPVVSILESAGVDVAAIDTLVLTHLHYDHAGAVRSFPNARVVVQQAELAYWTSPAAQRVSRESWLVAHDDVEYVRTLSNSAVVSGDTEVRPGLSVHLVGGHTAGTQVVRVRTAGAPVVIAADASHFYENIETDRPGTILHEMPGVYRAFDRVRELAGEGIVLPGHDTQVRDRYPSTNAERLIRIA